MTTIEDLKDLGWTEVRWGNTMLVSPFKTNVKIEKFDSHFPGSRKVSTYSVYWGATTCIDFDTSISKAVGFAHKLHTLILDYSSGGPIEQG